MVVMTTKQNSRLVKPEACREEPEKVLNFTITIQKGS